MTGPYTISKNSATTPHTQRPPRLYRVHHHNHHTPPTPIYHMHPTHSTTSSSARPKVSTTCCWTQGEYRKANLEHHDLDHRDGHARVLPSRGQPLGEQVGELLVQRRPFPSQDRDVFLGQLERCSLHRELLAAHNNNTRRVNTTATEGQKKKSKHEQLTQLNPTKFQYCTVVATRKWG